MKAGSDKILPVKFIQKWDTYIFSITWHISHSIIWTSLKDYAYTLAVIILESNIYSQIPERCFSQDSICIFSGKIFHAYFFILTFVHVYEWSENELENMKITHVS